jgi:hypothetical protein
MRYEITARGLYAEFVAVVKVESAVDPETLAVRVMEAVAQHIAIDVIGDETLTAHLEPLPSTRQHPLAGVRVGPYTVRMEGFFA